MTRRALLAALALALLAACGKPPPPPPPPPPTVVDLTLQAGADVNPDMAGVAKPVVVLVYRLASSAAFQQADFFALTADAQSALGPDLIGVDAFTLAPGASLPYRRELEPDARFVGLVVAYREIGSAAWRALAEVPPNRTTHLQAMLGAGAVMLAAGG